MLKSKTTRISLSLLAAVVLLAVSACASLGTAPEPAPPQFVAQSGYFKLKVGEVEVIALSDGTIDIDSALLSANPQQVQTSLVNGYEHSPVTTSVNAYLIRLGARLILVDTGTSELFGPSLGKLPATLRSAGFKPEQITDILLTHIHTDHSGGLMLGKKRNFPNAKVHVERKEIDFWLNPANKASAPAAMKDFFCQAVIKVTPYVTSGQIVPFEGSVELFPGIRTVPAPGHTPGHTLYALESKGEKLVFWGDVLHVAAVQLPDPSVTIAFDVTPAEARTQRNALFADAAAKGYLVAPAHINFPGFGRLRKEATGPGYRWFPVPYVNDAPMVPQ